MGIRTSTRTSWMITLCNASFPLILTFSKNLALPVYNLHSMAETVKSIPLRLIWVTIKVAAYGSRVQFIFMWIVDPSLRRTIPNMKVLQARLPSCLHRNLISKLAAILRASIHNKMGTKELLNILLTNSISVRFHRSAITFWLRCTRHCVLCTNAMLFLKFTKKS